VNLPVSTSISMRPVWARRQRRVYMQDVLCQPNEREKQDAIRVLEDPSNQFYAPALYAEAELILLEASL
jgi:hypothetical protein